MLSIPSSATANMEAKPAEAEQQGVSPQQMRDWLTKRELLEGQLDPGKLERRYQVFSSIIIGRECTEGVRRSFMRSLLLVENNMALTQYCIGLVDNPRIQYQLNVSNKTPIANKAMLLNPAEQKWLDEYLDELLKKKVITPILPKEDPLFVTLVMLVPKGQSGQAYRMVQNIIPVNKRTAEYQYQLNETRRYRGLLG